MYCQIVFRAVSSFSLMMLCGEWACCEIQRPNLLVIMTDNHGAWTLGCYGNREIRTPHIDSLAQSGLLFTRAFAANPVCSPTRATFLTGLLPSQHGVHCYLRAKGQQIGPQARNMLADITSLPEVLKAHGYRCGLVGKWHLGDNLHPQEGFADYWITMPHGATQTFHNADIIEHGAVRKEPKYLTEFWTDHAVTFLERSKSDERPFYLMLTYNGPYSLGRLLLEPGDNRHVPYYANRDLTSFPQQPMHPWQFNNKEFHNNPIAARRVATEVSGVDDGVGRVLEALDRLGLTQNTVVLFTADQGWAGGHGGFTGMGDHTRPLTAYDPMMRIPLIIRHPGHIAASRTSDVLLAQYDLFPTLLGYLNCDAVTSNETPLNPVSPGRDWSALIRGNVQSQPDDAAVFMEFESLRAIRTRRFKLIRRFPAGPDEFFDLQHDPQEKSNLIDDSTHAANIHALSARLDEFFADVAVPAYDLWHGGGSQTPLLVPFNSVGK